jgi:hypothetical protein
VIGEKDEAAIRKTDVHIDSATTTDAKYLDIQLKYAGRDLEMKKTPRRKRV